MLQGGQCIVRIRKFSVYWERTEWKVCCLRHAKGDAEAHLGLGSPVIPSLDS